MQSTDLHHNRVLISVLCLITGLNLALVSYFLGASSGGTAAVFNGVQLYVLAVVELALIVITYRASKRAKKPAIQL